MREVIQELWRNLRALAKWILFAGITGALVGLLGVVFGKCMAAATDFRANHDWVIWFLPAGGMVIIALYHLFKVYNPRGTNPVSYTHLDVYKRQGERWARVRLASW